MPIAAIGRTSAPKTINHNFSNYLPVNITLYRDGGTIKMEGNINRSFRGNVRFDGALNSPTRGKFFVTVGSMFSTGAEKPMKKSDLKELRQAIAKYIENDPGAERGYSILLRNIDQALGTKPAKPPSPAHLRTVFNAWEFHHAEFKTTKPPELKDNNVLKAYTLSKPVRAGMVGGLTVKAYVLKDQPDKVIFEKNFGGRASYFGPVSHLTIPKSIPR